MASLDAQACKAGKKGLLTTCQGGGSLDRMLRRYRYLRNPLKRGPASAQTPFITYGQPPVAAANSAAGWDINSVDFDSL